jgi:dTMP kinase
LGRLIAIEGIDGSGKGTQAAALVERAEAQGVSTALFSFPLYDGNPFSDAVAAYLNGAFGGVDEVHPELGGLLYACDRYHARDDLTESLSTRDLVICDRYVPSNLAHQGAKLSPPERDALVTWLIDVEYGEFRLPRPDLIVLLDAPPDVGRRHVGLKAPRVYTELEHDIHERAPGYLGATRQVFLGLASHEPERWLILPVVDETGEVRKAEDLSAAIWESVCRLA